MAKTEKISMADFEKLEKSASVRGAWKKLCEEVKKTGIPQKVSDVKRGQISAIVRTAKEEGLLVKADYKALFVAVAPAPKAEAPKK